MAPHGRKITTCMGMVKGQPSGHPDLSHSHWSVKNRRGKAISARMSLSSVYMSLSWDVDGSKKIQYLVKDVIC